MGFARALVNRRQVFLLVVAALVVTAPWIPDLLRWARPEPPGRPPTITASPNPVPRAPGPGTTTITWDSGQKRTAYVYVKLDRDRQLLFAARASGSQTAPWILVGVDYEFWLYADKNRTKPLASVAVRHRGEGSAALAISAVLVGATLALWAIGLQRAGRLLPYIALLAAVWVKVCYLSEFPRQTSAGWTLSSSILTLLAVFAPVLVLPRRWWFPAAILLNVGITLIGLADILHYRFFGDVIALAELGGGPQLRFFVSSILALLERSDAWLFLDVTCALVALPFVWRTEPRSDRIVWWRFLAFPVAAAAAIFWIRIVVPDYVLPRDVGRRLPLGAMVARRIGLLPFHLYDGLTRWAYTSKTAVTHSAAERREVEAYVTALRRTAGTPSPLAGAARGRNLVLILVESLAAFPLGLEVEGQTITPNLNALSKESLSFSRFYDQTFMGRTSDGEFMSMQSLHPLSSGTIALDYDTNHFRGLPAILVDRGYRTDSFDGTDRSVWAFYRLRPALGIQRMRFLDHYPNFDLINGSVADAAFLKDAGLEISRLPEPFMAHVLTNATHHPYTIPEHLRTLRLRSLDRTMLGDYLQAVHYLDGAVGVFINELRASGMLDRTVLALLGDHHPYLDDLLAVAETLGRPATDYAIWDIDKRLPLLIRLPGGEHAGTIAMPSGHIDLLPTLLSILGVPTDTEVTLGRDATAIDNGGAFVVFRDGSFVAGHTAFVAPSRFDESPRCFNLDTGGAADCTTIEGLRPKADERLRISDLIIGADLIPEVRLALRARTTSSNGSR